MDKDFRETMSQRTDKELAEILSTKRQEYQPEAVSAAQNEFMKRQLNVNDFITAEAVEISEKERMPIPNEDLPLSAGYKYLTVCLVGFVTYLVKMLGTTSPGFLLAIAIPTSVLIQFAIFHKLKTEGFDRMALDFKVWVLNTWIFYSVIFLILIVF